MENGKKFKFKNTIKLQIRFLFRPFWLSPRQMAIVPVFPSLDSYAQEVQKKLWDAGFQVDCDLDPGTTLNKKIRQNQLAQYNFIGGNNL